MRAIRFKGIHCLAVGAAGILTALGLSVGVANAATELTVYTAFEADQLKEYQQAFNEAHPDITINWVRDSTGIVTAKLLAEKENPQADVVWGLAATSLMLLNAEGMLEPYAPKGLEKLSPKFKDSANPPAWVGQDAYAAGIAFNIYEAEAKELPQPTSWEDLTKPVYKGYVVMPNPASSGTGFLMVSGWLQLFGEEKGWDFMDALHENIGVYTHSGSKPAKMAGSGEFPIGLSFGYRIATEKSKGAPIEVIFPSEGLGWELEAAAIIKGTDKMEAAQTLLDWAASRNAMEHYNQNFALVGMPGVAGPVENLPPPDKLEAMLIDNDFTWAAQNRERILAEWQKRYGVKSEPKE